MPKMDAKLKGWPVFMTEHACLRFQERYRHTDDSMQPSTPTEWTELIEKVLGGAKLDKLHRKHRLLRMLLRHGQQVEYFTNTEYNLRFVVRFTFQDGRSWDDSTEMAPNEKVQAIILTVEQPKK